MFILQVDFPFAGPFGTAMTSAMLELATDIASEKALVWKIWTEDAASKQAGGIYLFNERTAAEQYLDKHRQRLQAAGVTDIRSRIFAVNQELSQLNRAPL